MSADTKTLSQAADEAVSDVKRGARRVGSALADGVAAVDEALRPSFGAQLLDLVFSLADAPERTPGLARDLVKDHPIASLVTAALVGAGAVKVFKVTASR